MPVLDRKTARIDLGTPNVDVPQTGVLTAVEDDSVDARRDVYMQGNENSSASAADSACLAERNEGNATRTKQHDESRSTDLSARRRQCEPWAPPWAHATFDFV
jgi:hypothetical protein